MNRLKISGNVRHLPKIAGLVLLSAMVFGCGSNNKVEPTLTSLWDNEFNTCGVNCHSPAASDGTENGPDLTTQANFYNNLVGKGAGNYPNWLKTSDCNVDFITPGNADESSMVASLIQSYSDSLAANHNCVTAYNLHLVNHITISDLDLQNALVIWINNGAQNN